MAWISGMSTPHTRSIPAPRASTRSSDGAGIPRAHISSIRLLQEYFPTLSRKHLALTVHCMGRAGGLCAIPATAESAPTQSLSLLRRRKTASPYVGFSPPVGNIGSTVGAPSLLVSTSSAAAIPQHRAYWNVHKAFVWSSRCWPPRPVGLPELFALGSEISHFQSTIEDVDLAQMSSTDNQCRNRRPIAAGQL